MPDLERKRNCPRYRVLCVDNDLSTCEMLTELLRRNGVSVTATTRSIAALHAIKTGWFDLYLLDAFLPDIDGFELCRRIREDDPRTPILFYSGAAQECEIKQAMDAGATAYVLKPETKGLLEKISRLLPRALPPELPPLTIPQMANASSSPQGRTLASAA